MKHPRGLEVLLFLVVTAVAGGLAMDRIGRLDKASDDLLTQPFALVGALLDAHDHAFSAHTSLHDAVRAADRASIDAALARSDAESANLDGLLASLAAGRLEAPDTLTQLAATIADWNAMRHEVAGLISQGRLDAAHSLLDTVGEDSFRRQHDTMGAVLAAERRHADRLHESAHTAQRDVLVTALTLAILAGGAVAAVLLAYGMFFRTHLPLMSLRASLLALAAGHHDTEIPHTRHTGTIGAVARAVAHLKRGMAERDAATAALRLSEDRLKAALSIAPVAVYNLDRDLRYTWMYNPQGPIAAEEFIGRTSADFFADGDAERERLFRRVLATGQGAREEVVLRLRGTDDARHYDQIAAPLWGRDGSIVGLTCAAIDVTERVRAKQALEAAVIRAQRADDAKARFLAAASHDLRQPLQALRLFLDVMAQDQTTDRDRKLMAGALSALAAGEDLLGNLLDVSVLEAGILQPVLAAFPIRQVLDDVAGDCARAAAEKGVTLRQAPCSATVVSDPRLLRNLVRNLVANAVRYTDRGRILIGCRHVGGALRIEVWDTGIGIPDDKLTAVFEDFYQLGNLERDRTKGLGLGLSVVDRAARLLGHPVNAVSRLGKGSVFTVTVPLAQGIGRQAA